MNEEAKEVLEKLGLKVEEPDAQPGIEEVTQEKSKHQESIELLTAMYGDIAMRESDQKIHKFWDTQPVPKGEVEKNVGPLDEVKTVAEVRQEPYGLPAGFQWSTLNIDDTNELTEVYNLLNENYVEDYDACFRFDYSREFLKWALQAPGFYQNWHVGIRQSSNNKLLAMITGIPAKVHARGNLVKMAEINFLCIHKKLRSKRLAPVLIKEVTRRVNLLDQWSAVYTAGVYLPKPVGKCRYYHRTLNAKKLIDIGFSALGPRMTLPRYIRLYKVEDTIKVPGIRPMEAKDVPQVQAMLVKYLSRFTMWIEFDQHEAAHWLLPRDNVVYSYVVESSEGIVTDFVSFYNLPSTVIDNPKYSHVKAAYSFYNVATTVPLVTLMQDALVFAIREDFDVFNCLDLMENDKFIEPLKFGKGDGDLHYYFYNYFIPECTEREVGIVLL